MSQHPLDIPNQSGAAFRTDNNLAHQADQTDQSGATEPATKRQFMRWADTTAMVLRRRNQANTAWRIVDTLDENRVVAKAVTDSLAVRDFGKLFLCDAAGASIVLTLPAPATAGLGWLTTFRRENAGANTVTINGNGGTFDPGGGGTLVMDRQNQSVTVWTDGVNWFTTANMLEVAKLHQENEFTRQQNVKLAAVTDAPTIDWDCAVEQTGSVTLAGNRILDASNFKAGSTCILQIVQDATGNRTLGYNAAVFEFPDNGDIPVLSTAANAKDTLTCFSPDGVKLQAVLTKEFA